MDVFWNDGFAATSLDDISAATGLNRPSLYGAFGDKRALYLQAYGQYRKRMNESFAPLLAAQEPLRVKLRRLSSGAPDTASVGDPVGNENAHRRSGMGHRAAPHWRHPRA